MYLTEGYHRSINTLLPKVNVLVPTTLTSARVFRSMSKAQFIYTNLALLSYVDHLSNPEKEKNIIHTSRIRVMQTEIQFLSM